MSGASRPVITSQQRGLAVAVAPDDADPLPGRDAERDVGEQRAHAVRLGDALEVEEVRHQPRSPSTRWAPATGPLATSTTDSCQRGRRRRGRGRRTRRGRRRSVRSRRPCPRRAPAASPRSISVLEVGAQVEGGRLEVVVQRRAPAACGSPVASAASRASARRRRGRRRRGTARRSAGRPRASTGPRRTARRPTTRCRGRRPGVTTSPRPVPSAVPPTSANGTSLPSWAARASSSSSGVCTLPEPVERHQGGGGVGRAAGQAAGDRDLLGDARPRPRGPSAVVRGQQVGGAVHDVGAGERHVRRRRCSRRPGRATVPAVVAR